ncbi:MAG TPA: hypothetical protein VMX35_01110 [Acidobacteriota bacterium]|nr:hypothetical protein [Acidobacteriota bacterium]
MRSKSIIVSLLACSLFIAANAASAISDDLPKDFATFFGRASVDLLAGELPAGASLGNPARDDRAFPGHYNWAVQTDPMVVFGDLIDKFKRMADIKSARGRNELGNWYASVCTQWAGYGLDYGSSAANARDRATHYNWAGSSSTSLDAVKGEISKRLLIIFSHYRNQSVAELLRNSSLTKLLGDVNMGDATGEQSESLPSGKDIAEAFAAAAKGAAQSAADKLGNLPIGDVDSEMPWDPPAPGVAKIKDVRADPLYRFGEIVSGAKLFIIGWNLGTRPGRAYMVFDKPINGLIQIDLQPFDSRGWAACWFDEAILARMPDIGKISDKTNGYLILELPNGQRVRDMVFLGAPEN